MSGLLPKKRADFQRIPDAEIAIISSMWHPEIVNRMVARAVSELSHLGLDERHITVHKLPGCLELPVAAQVLFEKKAKLDGILAFGVVLKGETTHYDSVLQQVNQGFALVSNSFGKPIINQVFGVSNLQDAAKRAEENDCNKGLEAAFAISEFISWKRGI